MTAPGNAKLIRRLLHIKAQPIDPRMLEIIVGKRTLTAKEATQIEKQIAALLAEAERVERTRAELEQVPSRVQRGSVVL